MKSCSITTDFDLIKAECTYPNKSTATGFQLLAHICHSNEVNITYINQTHNRHTPATVQVDQSGTYQVSIFAIRGGKGIQDSNVEYIERVMVHVMMDTTQSGVYYRLFMHGYGCI